MKNWLKILKVSMEKMEKDMAKPENTDSPIIS